MGALTYIDASVLTALFVQEARSSEARARIVGLSLTCSDLALAEVTSAVGRRVRMGDLDAALAARKLADLDRWAENAMTIEPLQQADFAAAVSFMRRFELGLRTPDALHLAIAQRLGAPVYTFDSKMTQAAVALGVPVLT